MSLTSFNFFVFLIVVIFIYYTFPRLQKITILAASLFFYISVSPHKCLLLLTTIFCATYFGALAISWLKKIFLKKIALIVSIGTLVYILFFYKYAYNFLSLINEFFSFNSDLSFIKLVPFIGISYFSLSAIGYLVDVYWNSYKPEKNPLIVANFIYFFPQVISGPVTRFSEMKEQFIAVNKIKYENIENGIRRMMWGYFKKLVISERFAMITTGVYSHYMDFGTIDIAFATLCYAVQLYTDFSGCMDIIIGAAELFGIKMPENFNAPFFSRTIQEFWQRWHITLGLWFKDYVMFPVQMNPFILNIGKKCKEKFGKTAGKKVPFYISMVVLWFLIGIWHGATGYYFIASAVVPFTLLTLSDIFKPLSEKLIKKFGINTETTAYILFQRIKTTLLICICWVFVCSASTKNSINIISHMCNSVLTSNFVANFNMFYLGKISIITMIVGLSVLFFADYLQNKNSSIFKFVDSKPLLFKWSIIYAEILTIMVLGKVGSSQFIYFQF